jgi:DNA-directed RNA polymerase subunit beta
MRQAVPLLRSEAPIVGTGIEGQMIRDSRTQIMAEGEGVVEFVDASVIRINYDRTDDEEFVSFVDSVKEYKLPKFMRTNQDTTIDLRPIVRKGDKVTKGQILTEGYSTQNGELALGRNLKVAYIPWKGYNYEDAIVLNERIVREDIFTSVHVSEYSLEVRETKRGAEELTSDIPNVSEDATRNLDENGIIRIGAHVVPGDILIGKITPKGETDPTPEEKLLRAIFGDKAGDVKDASLKASPSLRGVIIGKELYCKAIKTRKDRIADKEILDRMDENFKQEANELEAGQKVSCIVRNIRKDFMEVEIDLGLKGIIKKIDVSADKKEQKTDKFTVGEKLDANIISFDNETGKLMLALKSLEDVEKNDSQEDDEEDFDIEQYMNTNTNTTLGSVFGNVFNSMK